MEKNPSVKCDLEVTNTSRVKDLQQISPPMKKQKSKTAKQKVEGTKNFETEISKSYQKKDFFCEVCHLQFDKKAVFDIHNSILHKSKDDIKNVPKRNEKSCQGLTVHEGQKFKCSICDTSFTQSGSLKTHTKTVHEGQKFKCSICDASFTQSGVLKRHIATVHEGQKSFKCWICDANFGRNYRLRLHVSTVHNYHTNRPIMVP